ncbi:MAG TPA: LiaF domain-containing protein, partial [Bacteroidota bacterium]
SDNHEKLKVEYDLHGDEGVLRIRLKKSSRVWGDEDSDDDHHRKLTVRLSDQIPISFDIELGAGRGDIDLSSLQIKELTISTGASSVDMRCDEPNTIPAENVKIESGVSKFTATNLCNTNFRKLKFSGGVGSYKLDFGGGLRHDASAKIEVGLGSVSVSVPRDVAAKLLYETSFFSSFDLDDDFSETKDGVYETSGFDNSANKLTIQIESGLGSVKVKRK